MFCRPPGPGQGPLWGPAGGGGDSRAPPRAESTRPLHSCTQDDGIRHEMAWGRAANICGASGRASPLCVRLRCTPLHYSPACLAWSRARVRPFVSREGVAARGRQGVAAGGRGAGQGPSRRMAAMILMPRRRTVGGGPSQIGAQGGAKCKGERRGGSCPATHYTCDTHGQQNTRVRSSAEARHTVTGIREHSAAPAHSDAAR